MKIGIVLQSNDPETAWNAFRFAITSQKSNHDVRVFLLGKGVEVERIQNINFDVPKLMKTFLDTRGEVYACGTCLEMRNTESKVCPISTMAELVKIVEESERVLVF